MCTRFDIESLLNRLKHLNISSNVKLLIFTWIFCFTGATWQIWQISLVYFRRETTMDMKVDIPSLFALPVITIGTFKYFLINETRFLRRFPNLTKEVRDMREARESNYSNNEWTTSGFTILDHINSISTDEQFEVLLQPDYVILGCWISGLLSENGKLTDGSCKRLASVKLYISKSDYGLVFFYNENKKNTYFIQQSRDKNDRFIQIKLRKEVFGDIFGVILQSPDEVLFNSGIRPIRVQTTQKNWVDISYETSTVELLPKPYNTKCKNYRDFGYESRKDCINKCKIKFYNENMSSHPGEVPVFPGENVRFSDANDELEPNCSSVCPEDDCVTTFYDIRRVTEVASSLNSPSEYFVTIDSPEKSITHKHKPKLDLVEYLCYIGSSISFWFGTSILSLFGNMTIYRILVKKTKERKRNKREDNEVPKETY